MKKKLSLIIFLLLNFQNMSYAIRIPTVKPSTLNLSTKKKNRLKFGVETDSIFILLGKTDKVGIFGEYKFKETLGMRIELLYTQEAQFLNSVAVSYQSTIYFNSSYIKTKLINLPILLRYYPGSGRNFCLFTGVQPGYIITGKVKFTSKENLSESVKIDLEHINEQDKIHRFQCGIVIGFEYEFDSGIFFGLSNTKELINIVELGQWSDNWKLIPSFGYNLGKLL